MARRLNYGEPVTVFTAAVMRSLIGKNVVYLRKQDIDRSGRGYYFPQYGTIAAVKGKNVAIDEPTNFAIHLDSLVEMDVTKD